jgi:hypothetical protein
MTYPHDGNRVARLCLIHHYVKLRTINGGWPIFEQMFSASRLQHFAILVNMRVLVELRQPHITIKSTRCAGCAVPSHLLPRFPASNGERTAELFDQGRAEVCDAGTRSERPHSNAEKAVLLDDRLRCRGSRPNPSGKLDFLPRSWSPDSSKAALNDTVTSKIFSVMQ